MRNRRILILGGTREARELAAALLAEGHCVITSLAGVTEAPLLPPGEVRRGGFGGGPGLAAYLRSEGIALVVDATHPFAAQMAVHAQAGCAAAGVPLLRLERPAWQPGADDRWTRVASVSDAAAALPAGARVLLTIGRKEVAPFFRRGDLGGIARMIEPPAAAPPRGWTVLQERPPFSADAETRLMREHGISWLVTKNAGGPATEAKLLAARTLRLPVMMVERPARPELKAFASAGDVADAANRLLSP